MTLAGRQVFIFSLPIVRCCVPLCLTPPSSIFGGSLLVLLVLLPFAFHILTPLPPIVFENQADEQAYELSILTGTQVLLLVVSGTGLVYTFTTTKLQPLVQKPEGKNLIQVRFTLLALSCAFLPYSIIISSSYSCFHSYSFSRSCRTAFLSPPRCLARTCFASPRKSLTSGLPQRTRRFRT